MERRGAGPIAEMDEAPVRIEERLDRVDVSAFRGGVNRMVGRLRKRPSETIASLFQDLRDRLVTTISGHYDQANVMICGLLRSVLRERIAGAATAARVLLQNLVFD